MHVFTTYLQSLICIKFCFRNCILLKLIDFKVLFIFRSYQQHLLHKTFKEKIQGVFNLGKKYANICFKTWFFGQKTRFSDLAISRWSVVSEIDFIQIIKITPGPHQNDNKTIVVEFLYTRNTSLNLTLRYYNQYSVVHGFTSVHCYIMVWIT